MKHSVLFNNIENHWDNALPFGNGVFGCMLFFERGRLHMPMNHYEVYYNISHPLLPKDKLEAMGELKEEGAEHLRRRKQADESQPGEDGLTCLFRSSRDAVLNSKSYGIFKFSETFPQTGELIFSFAKKPRHHSLALYLEDAKGVLRAEDTELETVVTRRDCIINTVRQGECLLDTVTVSFPNYRDSDPPLVEYTEIDSHTVSYTVTREISTDKTSVFTGILRFSGAEVRLDGEEDNSAVIRIVKSEPKLRILTAVFTDWQYEDTVSAALSGINDLEKDTDTLLARHSEYYREFFNRSITLPDKLLEKVYLINQYALDCCSGKDGVMKHQACGLNGLWAIRHPNLWGSKWYWDVNIQAAFAGVFSSNRLELAKVFSDGLLTYADSARRHAREVHGMSGMSIDYPYDFYYSCFVWCAQYMWYYYEYTLDKDYLKNEAYPVFKELCEFSLQLFEYDEKTDTYNVYPDVSPEQGPLTHNSVITVACVKYLLSFTLEAAELLGDKDELLGRIRHMLDQMPSYPLSRDGDYGVHLKDSDDADENMWIRHPSMLMPVFPIGEIGLDSDAETKKIISNTLDFLEDRCEIGIFGGSWLSAAASRIGEGQRALRLLYERGLDHMLRTNGLTAEETDRFINYCLITRQPLYYPCMMEFSGEMLAAVNEMLLQSHEGVIRVFPAIPDGDPEYRRYQRKGYYLGEYLKLRHEYPRWDNLSFTRLLAKGAFEISAELRDGTVYGVKVLSRKGGVLRISSDYFPECVKVTCNGAELEHTRDGNLLTFDTEAGKTYLLGNEPREDADTTYDGGIDTHLTHTKRVVSVGEDSETAYRRRLDGAMRDWYYGNTRMSNHTVYKFDFTRLAEKNYAPEIPPQCVDSGGIVMGGMDFVRLGGEVFTHKRGYGFDREVSIVDRGEPDLLRRDLAEGEEDTEFIIEMPRGQYELLVISGDMKEDSITRVTVANSRTVGGSVVPAGEYQAELIPVISEYDEPVVLKLSTEKGYKWKLCAIIVNTVKGY